MTLDILRKSGGWCVELQQPLKFNGREFPAVEIRPPTADHLIRWGQGRIASTLALLSELCDMPERLLRQLPAGDFDRVIMALVNVVPSVIKSDLQEGIRPLATPDEVLPESEHLPVNDQIDPRFPAHDGPIHRLHDAPRPTPPPPAPDDGGDMNLGSPPAARAVG